MPLNPGIPGALAPLPQMVNPMETMQGIMGMQAQREQMRHIRLLGDANQKKQEDDEALRLIIPKHIRPGTGVPDWEGVIEDLQTTGHAPKAFEVQEWVTKQRGEEADATQKALKITIDKLALGTSFMQAMTDEISQSEDPAIRQAAFDRYKPFIVNIVGKELGGLLGDKPDVEKLTAQLAWGRSKGEQLTASQQALSRLTEARLKGETDQKMDGTWRQTAGDILAGTNNQEDWTLGLKTLDSQGIPAKLRSVIPDQYSPEAAAQMRNLAIPAKDRETLAGAKDQRIETARHDRALEADQNADRKLAERRLALDEGDQIALTPAAIEANARRFAATGQLPTVGMGKRANAQRAQIMNMAADLYPKLDIATNAAEYHANRTSLVGLTKMSDQLKTFEDTALKNLETFVDAAKGIDDTGSPYFNKPIRAFSESVLGDPKMSAYNTARRVVLPEFARILNQFGQNGVLSDTARRETEEALQPGATMAQILSASRVLVTDAKNRRESTDSQIEAITKRIATPPPAPGAATPPPPGGMVRLTNGLTGSAEKHFEVAAGDVDAVLAARPGFKRE